MSKYNKYITNTDIENKKGGKTFFKPSQSDRFDKVVNTFSKRLDQLINQQREQQKEIYHKEKATLKEKYEFEKKQISKNNHSNYERLDEKRKEEEDRYKNLRKQKSQIVSFLKNAYDENPLAAKVIVVRKLEQSEIKYNQVGINNIEKYDLESIRSEFNEEKKKILDTFDFKQIDKDIKNNNAEKDVYKRISGITKDSINKFVDEYEEYIKEESIQFLQKSLQPDSLSKTLIANIIYSNIRLNQKVLDGTMERRDDRIRRKKYEAFNQSLSVQSS